MAHSFSTSEPPAPILPSGRRRRVLVTGASGNIGSYFAEHSHFKYDLRLMVQQIDDSARAIAGFGEIVVCELSDLERLKLMCAGIDTVVHLAGNGNAAQTWSSVLENNITGTYHMCVAAKAAGCSRMVYASSIHAVSGYPRDVQVKASEPVNPGDLYGVSKCFGEALGRYMAEQEGLSVIALRIGAFLPLSAAENHDLGMMDGWISWRDMNQLIEKSIDVKNLRFAILNAVSDNRFKRLDISEARELVGYAPQDDFTRVNPLLKDLNLAENVVSHSAIQDGYKSGMREELRGKGPIG